VVNAVGTVSGATSTNFPGAIVIRDGSGNFGAGTITANLAGNATTATTAANVTGNISDAQLSANVALLNRTNQFTGVVIATNANNVFSGTLNGNASTATSATSAITATTAYNFSGSLAGDVTGPSSATMVYSIYGLPASVVASGANAAYAATNANMAGAIVKRDASGNFAAGTVTANLAGNAATATTATNLVGNVSDSQLSANIARLNGTNLFAGVVNAPNPNNNLNGNISGNGNGLTNLPTMLNYVYSYSTNTMTVTAPGNFQDVGFNADAQINGWTHAAGTGNFTNGPAGLYLVEYAAETTTANNSSGTTVSIHAMLNGMEVPGSQSATTPDSSGLATPVSKSFIVAIPTANTNVLKLQFAGSNVNNRLISNTGLGTTRPSVSMTIIRIQ
jgi:hypothetical protein